MKRRLAGVSLVLALGICAVLVAMTGAASAEPPVVVVESATNPTYTTVEVAGKVNAEGISTLWVFQISADGGATWKQAEGTNSYGFSEGSTLEPVGGTLEQLRAGVTYKLRLIAENFVDPVVVSPEVEFTTESVPAPTVTIDPIGAKTDTTAALSGSITANSPVGDPAVADVNWHFACSPACATSHQGTIAAGQSESVQATATGLEPNTEYTVTLVGENAGPPVTSSPVTFGTPVVAPASETLSPNVLGGGTNVKLRGNVDPNNSPAEYWFEYGPTTAYGQFAPVAGRTGAGAGRGHVVSQEIGGLTPGATYHYQLVAEGPGGRDLGGDVEFTTAPSAGEGCPNEAIRRQQHATRLPECRAYELVSPANKEGGWIGLGAARGYNVFYGIRASEDGDAAIFTTTTALPGSTSAAWLYKATRSGSGWSSAQISLPAPGGVLSPTVPLTNVSEDLSTGMFLEGRAFSASELLTGTENVVLHRLEPGGATTRLNPGQSPGLDGAAPRGQSKDLSHALFTSDTALTPDAPTGASSNLYDYTAGAVHLVSILPNGQPDPVGAALGTNVSTYGGNGARFNAVSDDGNRIDFTALSDNQVYQRINGTRTVEVSASQGGADPTGAFPAQFVGATTSGSKVFFTSTAELTPDANTGGHSGKDLYEYDVASGALTDLTVDENPGDPAGANVLGLAGLADNGSMLYVVAEGVLAPGAVAGRENLYAVRPGGSTDLVATLFPGFNYPIWEGGPSGGSGEGLTPNAQAAPNGRYLAFVTGEKLTPDAVPGYNAYLYDADASSGPKLVCVSCGPGNAEGGRPQLSGHNALNLETFQPRFVFDDGAMFFTSGAGLVEEDTNGRLDVYEYHDGDLSLLSSGRGNAKAEFADASDGGQDVLIVTASRLVASDHDETEDVYEVRVDGGFPEPPVPSSCAGEGCRPPATAPPAASTPGSSAMKGSRRSSKDPFSVGKISGKQVAKFARTGKLTLHVRAAEAGTFDARAFAKLGQGKRQVGHARKSIARPSSTSLVLPLSTGARKRLAESGRLKVTIRVSFSGAPKPSVRTLTLLAAQHGRKGR